MRDRIVAGQMPKFWRPKPSRFWMWLLGPIHRSLLHHRHGIADVSIEGMERLRRLDPADSALICPNHSYTGDGSVVMEFGRRTPRLLNIMAAWHVFAGHGGLDGWMLQRFGGFSVDREGCDRRAMKTAIELLSSGRFLVIFPEGEIYHLNEKLTPLRDGVAFLAASAQRDLEKAQSSARVWIVPTAIRYDFVGDIRPGLTTALEEMERRMMLKPRRELPLHERIVRLGEFMLTIKEKEKLGRSRESDGDLPKRIHGFIDVLLDRLEGEHLKKSNTDEPVPVRVKLLRRQLLEPWCEEGADESSIPQPVRDALADVHLVLQLYSYPGDYITTRPTQERMAETIEKFEEDVYGTYAKPKGARRATVVIGEPIDVKEHTGKGKARAAAENLTAQLEERLANLMRGH